MSFHASSGNPTVNPQRYYSLPIAIISQSEQQDRWFETSELKQFTDFFKSGMKLLEVAVKLTENAEAIVSAGANRIFFNGATMAYLEPPPYRKDLPGSGNLPRPGYDILNRKIVALAQGEELQPPSFNNPFKSLSISAFIGSFDKAKPPLPDGFRRINVARYGPVRMKRSMRDLSWFLRYVTYAIVAGDSSILTANCRGLRGVIPEDVTEATVVALQEMQWKSLSYFKNDPEATAVINEQFDAMITSYAGQKLPMLMRKGVANDQQGLQLPVSYILSRPPRPKFLIRPNQSATDTQAAIKAAYRQVFERDVTREYGVAVPDLESKVKSGNISVKEFIRQLGKSRLYRREFYEPYVITRVIELAVRHFLGRGLSSTEEFQTYFDTITQGGLPALVDQLVDSPEYSDYFGEETVPYLRGLGQEAQEFRNWGPQVNLLRYSASAQKYPQFITLFGDTKTGLPAQHAYGSGNDPLEIQFGAIFPLKGNNFDEHPALFGQDSKRILISSRENGGNEANQLAKVPGSLMDNRVLKLEPSVHPIGKGGQTLQQGVNVSVLRNSPEAAVQGIYRQVFGDTLFGNQRLEAAELKLKSGEISVREFIRQLAKSRLFRRLYWEPLYVTKAIEYIHRRLLGRPTYGRREMNRYYDICSTSGFYALIDALIDSPEYLETFGEDTAPYERYVTPRGFALRASGPYSGGLGAYAVVPGPSAGETRVSEGTWVKDATPRGVQVYPQSMPGYSKNEEGKTPDSKMDGAKQPQTSSASPSVKQEQESTKPKPQAAESKQAQNENKRPQEESKESDGG